LCGKKSSEAEAIDSFGKKEFFYGKEADQRGRVSIKPRELVSSAGFSVEYENKVFDQELREDIVSYLGEYRFKLQNIIIN